MRSRSDVDAVIAVALLAFDYAVALAIETDYFEDLDIGSDRS